MANREQIQASIEIDATAEQVWALISDPTRMPEWSPQCRKTIVRGKGPVGVGTTTLNVNRRGALVWPTRSKVTEFVPGKRFAFRIVENGTEWSYDLEPTATGTRVTESRHAPHGVSAVSNTLTKYVLGGTENFEVELEEGMRQTLERIKATAEGTSSGKA